MHSSDLNIMIQENVILQKEPRIEFQLLDSGFQVIDEQTALNSGFYAYSDLQSIELNQIWFPRLAGWLRGITWILNGVPLFPDAASYKKANIIIRFRNTKLGMWLTDSNMAIKAKKLKALLDKRAKHRMS